MSDENSRVFSEFDSFLFHQGTNYEVYQKLGAHPDVVDGVAGTRFAVWAPNAQYVSVICAKTGWENEQWMSRSMWDGGVWECFLPEVGPGDAYRYVITEQETAGAKAVTYDTQATTPGSKVRYLDVYVADVNNALTVRSYVMHETATVVDNNDTDGKADDKSSSYVNEISTKNLEFGKEVTGNQGSKDKYFKFQLVISNAQANTTYSIDLTSAEASPTATDATSYSSMTNPNSFITNGNGDATITFYLKDGQYIKIPGLPDGYGYTLTETEEDYASSETISADNGKGGVAYDDGVTGTNVSTDIKTGFTNDRTGIIPTGVIMTIAPFAIGICVFGAIIIFIICRRKRRNY